MRTVASLPAKWREEAEIYARMSKDRQWAEWLRGECEAKAAKLRGCADELEAALASPAPSVRDREADRRQFPDADFNAWLDTGISDCGHTVWSALGDVQAAWQGWGARQFAGDAVLLAECCGREECGGECGKEWRGMGLYRKPTDEPAAPSASPAGEGVDLDAAAVEAGHITWRSMQQCADAWLAVNNLLHELAPDWTNNSLTGREAALAAIRRLATAAGSVQGEAVAWRIHWSPQFPDGFELTSNRKRVDDCRALDNAPRIEPLYTTPPPAPAAEQPGRQVESVAWRGIDNLPDDERMVLAKCDDGRAMVWRASILARNLRGPTPEHLQFPATKWMPIPGDAAMLAAAPAAPGAVGVDDVRGAVARGWCSPANSHKVMDTDLAEAIVVEVTAALAGKDGA